jgi:hypothetical protein
MGVLSVMASKKPPQKDSGPNMAYRYERAYQLLFKKQSEPMQKRILDVKGKPDVRDFQVDTFIKEVIDLAEGDKEL